MNYLYHKGEMCVADKHRTQKYFDTTKCVVSLSLCETEEMSLDEFLEWYMARLVKSLGCVWNKNGGAWQGHFLDDRKIREDVLRRLLDKNSITAFSIEGMNDIFYTSHDFMVDYADKRQEEYVCFIALLDNMMWDRAMVEQILDFSYRWEMCKPVVKRVLR